MATATRTHAPAPLEERPAVQVLAPRTYASAGSGRLFVAGTAHPAKQHPQLCSDLFRRYTLLGQTVLDPFLGRGTSLLGCTLGRNVVGVELEPHFCAYARENWRHLQAHTLPGLPLGWALILQGDSRRLPLQSADACVTSPPYGGTPLTPSETSRPEAKIERLEREGKWREAQVVRMHGSGAHSNLRSTGYGSSPGQIGNLPHVDAAISSPPYADLASRDRSQEGYALEHPERAEAYGASAPNRHVDGYGETAGQIGNLRHVGVDAAVTSPPYADVEVMNWVGEQGSKGNLSSKRTRAEGKKDYGSPPGQLGNTEGEDYASACLAVYRECHRVIRPGGVLVLVTGNYVRGGQIVGLAAETIRLCEAAGWTLIERWEHRKRSVSFWRRLHHRQGRPIVAHEDVLVFCKGERPAWEFAELPPTTAAPVDLDTETARGLVAVGEAIGIPLPMMPAAQEAAG